MTVHIVGGQVAGVIDKSLLESKADEQGLRLDQLRILSLHSLHIIKIDHLWIFENLNILKLNENNIEKIENIDKLINLTELNLSFNKIKRIENLDKLTKLEKLSLHCNEITKLEALECLHELHLLSVSKNKLDSLDNVIYLRKLKKLHALSLEENPLCENENYKDFIIAFLPKLQYYDFKLVNRTKDYDINYKQQLARLQEEEEELALQKQQEKEKQERSEVLREAFVDMLDVVELLTNLHGAEWTAVMQVGADTITTIQKEHKEQMQKVCSDLQELGLQQLQKRKEELQQFKQCLHEASEANRQESMNCVNNFLEPKESMYRSIRRIITDMEKKRVINEDVNTELDVLKDVVYKFNEKVENLWHALMVLEVELQEQVEEVTKVFDVNMKNLVNNFIEEAKTLLLQARDLEEQFHARVEGPCQLRATNLRLQMNDWTEKNAPIGKTAIQLTSDPANLHDCLRECHEERLQAIMQRETQLEDTCQAWVTKLIKDLNMEAFKRSRSRILEINNFMDMQRKEISDLQPISIAFMGLL